jgi:hypothetical protein
MKMIEEEIRKALNEPKSDNVEVGLTNVDSTLRK